MCLCACVFVFMLVHVCDGCAIGVLVNYLFAVALPQGGLIGSTGSTDPRHSGPCPVAIIVVMLLT